MQSHRFSDREGALIAVEIERRGCEFYKRTARISQNADMRAFLNSLADDEAEHMRRFESLCEGCSAVPYDEETNAYLTAVAADVVFTGGLTELARAGETGQAAVLAQAIRSEKDSILFYAEMSAQIRDADVRDVYLKIVAEEKGHLARLQSELAQTGKDEEH